MTDRLSLDAALSSFWAHGAYVLFVIAVVLLIPPSAFTASGHDAIVIVGVVGAWRYGWGLLHFIRSIYFRRFAYPKMRAEAERRGRGRAAARVPSRDKLSHRHRDDASGLYGAIRAAFQAPGRAVIVASIVEMADQRIIKEIFDAQNTVPTSNSSSSASPGPESATPSHTASARSPRCIPTTTTSSP